MEPAVIIGIGVGAVVVIVDAISADEEIAWRLGIRIVIPVIIAIDLEVIPHPIVVIVDIPMIVNTVEVVVEIGRIIDHA